MGIVLLYHAAPERGKREGHEFPTMSYELQLIDYVLHAISGAYLLYIITAGQGCRFNGPATGAGQHQRCVESFMLSTILLLARMVRCQVALPNFIERLADDKKRGSEKDR